MLPFNKPCIAGNEMNYISDAIQRGKISGNGYYTEKCQSFFENKFGFNKVLLTHSCTDALEMAAILLNIVEGDEVIMSTYTYVSTANAFVLRGAKIIFADTEKYTPNIDANNLAHLITKKTKAIVVTHYGGIAVNMQVILELAAEHHLFIVEDAAAAIGAYYNGLPVGSIGHLATFSFHETKNVQCGEGGMLVINDERFIARAEIIWEKGTNRAAFSRNEVNRYEWVDIGSSFTPSELNAAFLFGQLENFDYLQSVRAKQWETYRSNLAEMTPNAFRLIKIPHYAAQNHHVFALLTTFGDARENLSKHLLESGILAVSHYQCLHKSPYFHKQYVGPELPNSIDFEQNLLRLPIYPDLKLDEIITICDRIKSFF